MMKYISPQLVLVHVPLEDCMSSCRLTWFWIRSLTRSMGAAAVLETAAETPPTVNQLVLLILLMQSESSDQAGRLFDVYQNVLRKSTTKPCKDCC
jgi:hypothetical protein